SSIGLIVTNGEPGVRGTSQTVGADFNYRNSARADGSVLEGNLFAIATRNDPTGAPAEDDYAFGGRIDWSNDPWGFMVFAAQVGHDFDPALGFVSRPGEREYQASADYRIRPNGGTDFIRSVDLITRLAMYTDLSGEVNSLQLFVPTISILSAQGDFARFHMELTQENLDEPFEIDDGNVIPVGRYDWWEASTNMGTSASRPVSGNVFYAYGEFYSGRRTDWGGGLSWQPNASFTTGATFTQNEIRLPTGDFDVQIVSANMDVQFTPEIRWSTILQWDNRSDSAGLNSRLRWEFEPGQDVFIVYNDNYDTENDWAATDTAVVVKVGLTLRF
ncbi:MAG: hypothetical protein KDA28_03030, partial [Phycisphaerales bacterium]|nr:hypothetical protein [Phycisphaerales bacterium]